MTKETAWQDRVRAEAADLEDKLSKLDVFQAGEAFGQLPYYERDLLIAQRGHMANYLSVLQARIGLFPVPVEEPHVDITAFAGLDNPGTVETNPVLSAAQLVLTANGDGTVTGLGVVEVQPPAEGA